MNSSNGEHFFDEIISIIERLRAPDGCPWDREQKLEDLRTYIVEEAYELTEAISLRDMSAIKEEAGDLLLQIVFISSLANEQGDFSIRDVVRVLCEKLVRRHPHVFADRKVNNSAEVLQNWEQIKLEERRNNKQEQSVLAGVPKGLPSLLKAHRLQGKAAHVGFDWPKGDLSPLFKKLQEEVKELEEAISQKDSDAIEDEMGDLLFMAVNVSRHLNVNPDVALARACTKFSERFRKVEAMAAADNLQVSQYSLEELDKLWERAKIEYREEPNL